MAIVEDPEQHEIATLAALVPSFASLRVLEIGSGDGRLTRRYASEAASVLAIDPDAEAIAALGEALPNVEARAMGIAELTLAEQSVDVVLFGWSL